MGNGLSQNEIDALLAGVDESVLTTSNTDMDNQDNFKSSRKNAGNDRRSMEDINEFLSEALGSGVPILSRLTENEVAISTIKAALKDSSAVLSGVSGKVVTISQVIKGALNGELTFILQEAGALKLIERMLDQEETVLSEISLSTLAENFNQYLSAVYKWIERSYNRDINSDIPRVAIVENPIDIELSTKQSVEVPFNLVLDNMEIPILLVLPVTISKEIINLTLKGSREEYVEDASSVERKQGKQVNARPVQFSRLDENSGRLPLGNIEILLDVSMQVTVELGRTKMRIREILGLGEGSIIELQKLAGEPVDILVNAKLIAKGEVVVIDEYFGVRITEIISPSEIMNIMSIKDEG